MVDIISELLEIGLTEYEAKAYSVLLKQNVASATEITKIGNVPRGRIYDILKLLIKKGFCVTVPGAVKKFKAVNPEVAIHNLIELQKKKEQRMKETAIILQEVYDNQEDTSSPLEYVQVYTTKTSMIKKAEEMANNCNKIFRTFNKPPYATMKKYDNVIRKGPKFKAIYEIEENNPEDFISWVKNYEQRGEEIRLIEKLPLKLIISDENIIMFTLKNRGGLKNDLTSIVVEHSDLTDALIELFEIYWEKSMLIEEFMIKEKV
jgi:sugar-specific transcriptional regulator TrmB